MSIYSSSRSGINSSTTVVAVGYREESSRISSSCGSNSISSRTVVVIVGGGGEGEGEVGVVGEERRGVVEIVEVGEEALQSSCFLSKGAYTNTVCIYKNS